MTGESLQVIRAAQSGDRRALEALLRELYPVLIWSARLELAPDDADDAVQTAVLRLVGRIDQYDPDKPLLLWAMGFLRHAIADHRRTVRRHVQLRAVEEGPDGDEEDIGTPEEQVPAPSPSPLELVEQRLTNETLLELAKQLSPAERHVLNLRCHQDLTFREIAELTGMRVNRAHKVWSRARRRLLRLYRDSGGDDL